MKTPSDYNQGLKHIKIIEHSTLSPNVTETSKMEAIGDVQQDVKMVAEGDVATTSNIQARYIKERIASVEQPSFKILGFEFAPLIIPIERRLQVKY